MRATSTPSRQASTSGLIEVRLGRYLFHRVETFGSSTPKIQILLIHGTCASSLQFDALLQAFSDILEESVVYHLFDAISCGNSPRVHHWGAYHTDEAVLDLVAIMEKELSSELPTIVIAHSYAPTIVIRCFHRQGIPNHIKGCVFLSSGMCGDFNPIPNGGHPIFRLPVCFLQFLQPSLTKSFVELAYHPKTRPSLIQAAAKSNNGNNMYVAKAFHRHHQWVTSDECTALQGFPVLILHGEGDRILPKEAGAQLADMIKGARFVEIEDTSHQIMEEKPVAVAQHIVALFRDIKLI